MFRCLFQQDESKSSKKIFAIENEKSNKLERTLLIIRGDGIVRGLVGKILTQIEDNDLVLIATKTIKFTPDLVDAFYGSYKQHDFYPKLVAYLTHWQHFAYVVHGPNAIAKCMVIKGDDPAQDLGNTLRKQYGIDRTISTIHCSDSTAEAEKEIALCFKPEDIPSEVVTFESYKTTVSKTIPLTNSLNSSSL
jgi:nucleoside-diphosphate kinase